MGTDLWPQLLAPGARRCLSQIIRYDNILCLPTLLSTAAHFNLEAITKGI